MLLNILGIPTRTPVEIQFRDSQILKMIYQLAQSGTPPGVLCYLIDEIQKWENSGADYEEEDKPTLKYHSPTELGQTPGTGQTLKERDDS